MSSTSSISDCNSETSESSNELRELLPLEKAKSGVWEYFGFPAENGEFTERDRRKRNEVFCKLCPKKMNYQGNTTNMMVHLQYNHRSEYLKAKEKTKTKRMQPPRTTTSSCSDRQPSITEAFHQMEPLSQSSKRWKQLNNSVCQCIAKDMLPVSIVNNCGFRNMLHTFEPRFVLPDRKTFTQHYLPEMHECEKKRIANSMKCGLRYFSLTTDGWTSRTNHSYIAHTIHYIDHMWNLQSHLLDVAEMSVDHTAMNLADELQESLVHWDLQDDLLVSVTTDNARNIVNATEILAWPHFSCFAHTLQLGVKKAMEIPQISKALARARRVVTHFHHSSKSSYILQQKQIDLHVSQLNLIQDVTTRWNSTYYMIDRLLQQQQPLCATLIEVKKTELMPSDSEITSLETFMEVLQPIVQITEAIGGESLVTISAVRPLLHKLLSLHLTDSSSDSPLAKAIKKILMADLKDRYSEMEVMSLINKACLLDPRFKSLAFLAESDKKGIINIVEKEAQELTDTISNANDHDQLPPTKKPKGLMSLLDDVVNCKSTDSDLAQPSDIERRKTEVEKEMYNYLCLDTGLVNPLIWWRDNEKYFPRLSQLARKYLCVPATSVPSERAFSAAGHVVNEKRSSLLPENVNMLVFLSANLQVDKKINK